MAGKKRRSGGEQTPPAADTIKKQIPAVLLRMDFMRNPEDALLKWGYAESYEKWYKRHFEELVSIVAQETGASPEQIADKDKRTPEQQRLLTEAAARQMLDRMDAFFKSVYMDAVRALEPLQGDYPDPAGMEKDPDEEQISVKEQAVLYFFASHDEITPTDNATLTEEQRSELKAIFYKLDAFYMERTNGGEITPDGATILLAFIEKENPTPEAAESIAEKLPLVQNIRPTAHTMPNNALMNTLQQKQAINAGAFDMVVANAKKTRKEITAYTMISYDDPGETGISLAATSLSEYERQVSNAIVSLWIEAVDNNLPTIFTADMIFRAMPGGGDKASPQQKGAITKTIEKFRRLHIYVDATEEFRKRHLIPEDTKYIFDEYYLNVRRHTAIQVKNGGAIVQGYEILTQPVILTYSKMTKQLLTVSAKHLAIEKVKDGKASKELLPMTANRQAMTGYMLRRIAVMRHDEDAAKEAYRRYEKRRKSEPELKEKPLEAFRDKSRVILFDSLFKEAGAATTDRKQVMLNRNFCFEVLDFWRVTGFIKDYDKQGKRRSITGVEIMV